MAIVKVKGRRLWSSRGLFDLAVAGVLGNLIVTGLRRVVPSTTARDLTIQGVAGGIRAGRWIGKPPRRPGSA